MRDQTVRIKTGHWIAYAAQIWPWRKVRLHYQMLYGETPTQWRYF